MNYTFTNYQGLLDDFKKLHNPPKAEPTFLSILGKPKDENIISNILSFFFDSNQVHNLGTLFLDTYLECLDDKSASKEHRTVSVKREVTTASGKRIDLIIETNSVVLVIENKVFHELNNDLHEYALHAKRLNRRKEIKLSVLSLFETGKCEHNFINVTYSTFFGKIKETLEQDTSIIKNNYSVLLNDLLKTVENLKTNKMTDSSIRNFFITRQEEINQLIEEKNKLDREINDRAHYIKKNTSKIDGVSTFVWSGNVVVNEKKFNNGLSLKVDCVVTIEGYYIHVFIQRHGVDDSLQNTLLSIPYFKDVTDWNYWSELYEYDYPIQDLVNIMNLTMHNTFANI